MKTLNLEPYSLQRILDRGWDFEVRKRGHEAYSKGEIVIGRFGEKRILLRIAAYTRVCTLGALPADVVRHLGFDDAAQAYARLVDGYRSSDANTLMDVIRFEVVRDDDGCVHEVSLVRLDAEISTAA